MTVAATNSFSGPFTGNGVTTAFPFTFEATDTAEVAVDVDGFVQSSGFTVTLNAGGNGGTVTFSVAPASGTVVIPFLDPDFTQDISFTNAGRFLPATHTEGFDRAAIRAIYLKGLLDRTILAPLGSAGLTVTAADEGGVIGVGADGALEVLGPGAFIGATGTIEISGIRWVTPQMFQVAAGLPLPLGGGVQDDSPAFIMAIAYLKLLAVYSDIYYTSSPKLFVPAGHYFMGTTTLDLAHTFIMEGEGQGMVDVPISRLRWAAGATGIRTQRYNTAGIVTIAPGANAGDGCILRGLYLQGGYAGVEGEYHGIHLRSRAGIEDCFVINWQGDGLYSIATATGGGADEGNANSSSIRRSTFTTSRRGIFVDGADTNVWKGQELNVSGNRQWGIEDDGFLGNDWDSCHAAANGWYSDAWIPTATTFGGNRYGVKVGQAVGASTNAPSGTTADNTWWVYNAPGGVFAGVPAWVSGTTFREGGSYKTDNLNARTNFRSCYSEGDQNTAQVADLTRVDGGLHAAGINGGVGLRTTTGATFVIEAAGGMQLCGTPTSAFELQSRDGTTNFFNFAQSSTYYLYNPANGNALALSAAGALDVLASYSVAGTKVIGARGAAVADAVAAAGAPTQAEFNALVTQFNLLAARLRAATGHGLIA